MAGGGVCPFRLTWRLLYHVLLTGTLLAVTGAQGVLLDIYILAFDQTTSLNYFWLLPDFLMVFPYVAAMCSGYRRSRTQLQKPQGAATAEKVRPPIYVRVFGPRAEPVYVWLAYTTLMVAKIVVIFRSEIPNKIDPDEFLSPQLLKITICATALVFGLLVEGQSAWESDGCVGDGEGVEASREAYIRSLSHGTALETLDSVAFLSLLVQSESQLVLPLHLEHLILSLACINFFLPALTLTKLSHADYGRGRLHRVLPLVYKLIHLWLTNFSFMVIRIYLWAGLSASVSPFLVKNVYHVFAVMREVWVECRDMYGGAGGCVGCWYRCRRRRRVYSDKRGSSTLNDVSGSEWGGGGGGGGGGGEDKFEEIDLKQSDSRS